MPEPMFVDPLFGIHPVITFQDSMKSVDDDVRLGGIRIIDPQNAAEVRRKLVVVMFIHLERAERAQARGEDPTGWIRAAENAERQACLVTERWAILN
jgi:hypothetical protein